MQSETPKIAVGAPVAERAWILPRWYECLERQTVRPDSLCFVYSPFRDQTLDLIHAFDILYAATGRTVSLDYRPEAFVPREARGGDPEDPWKARHLSDLRNALRDLFLRSGADVFVSLDTDVLLEDERVIEGLIGTLDEGYDVVAATTFLHVGGEASGCYNAGWWAAGDQGDPKRVWRRATRDDVVASPPPLAIDVPMAAYAMRRRVLERCRYKPHECGEDLGFADELDLAGMRVAWRTDLVVRHVWGPRYL